MRTILTYFFKICLLRDGPEKIPSNLVLAQIVCSLYLLTQLVTTFIVRSDLTTAGMLIQLLLSIVLEATILFTLLRFKSLQTRFLPSLTAFYGCNLILLLITMPLHYLLITVEEGSFSNVLDTIYLLCLFWWFSIAGFIFHRAANISLFQGIVAAFSVELLVAYTTTEAIKALT